MQNLSFNKIHDHFAEISKKIFDEDGELSPILFAMQLAPDDTGEMIIERGSILNGETFEKMFNGEDGKRKMMSFIKDVVDEASELHQHFKKTMEIDVNAVIQVSEAWMGKQVDPSATVVPPSQDPERKEAVIVAIHNKWCKTVVGVHEVHETPSRHLVVSKLDPAVKVEGEMVSNPSSSQFGPH